MKELILFIQHDSPSQWFIPKPFSIKHDSLIPIILSASSPALSFKPLSYILHLLNIRVVSNAIAHIHIFESESLISLLSFLVIEYAPTIGFSGKHIAFPSLSIIIQIQHLSMLNSTHFLSIHSQQLMRINIHFDHSIQTQFQHNGMGLFNQPFMIPTQSIMFIQHQISLLCIILRYPLTILLILQDLHQWNQHLFLFFFTLLHEWMLLIILHPITLTSSNAFTLHLPSTLFPRHFPMKSRNSFDLMLDPSADSI